MSDPRFEESELPAKPDRSLRDRGDRLGLVVASAAFAGVVVLAVLYTQMKGDRLGGGQIDDAIPQAPHPSPSSNCQFNGPGGTFASDTELGLGVRAQ
jgi:hypothetical protein